MTISQMLEQSGILTLLGMGVVFSFLIVMILAMTALHAILHAFHLDKDEKPAPTSSVANAPVQQNTDINAVVAAIATAIHEK